MHTFCNSFLSKLNKIMVINPFFNNISYTPTQNLIEDLIIENIKIHGVNMLYVPRELVNEDKIYGEDRESLFENAFEIEMYIDSFQEFGGNSDFISKFGLEITDEMNLSVSKKRFTEETALERPFEGDLIYFPLSSHLIQIDFVEFENPFYQLGKRYVYMLKCSTYDFSHDNFETGIQNIDTVEQELENLNSVINDKYAQNADIIEEANTFTTFNPDNPFGE